MTKRITLKALNAIGWLILTVALLLAGLIVALYNPVIQRNAIAGASRILSTPPERVTTIGRLRLSFPLTLDVERFVMKEHGDTMIGVDEAHLDLSLLPLLTLRAEVGDARLRNAVFTLGTPDSTLYLRLRDTDVDLRGASVSLLTSRIDVDEARVGRGRLALALLPDTTATPRDTTSSGAKWRINARRIEMDNLDYSMTMMPTIDSIGAHIVRAVLDGGSVDMTNNTIHAQSLQVDSVTATYLFPDPATVTPLPTVTQPDEPSDSEPWTITADHIGLTATSALYAMADAKPQPGLDFNYLQVSNVVIDVDSFYNRAVDIRVPLKQLTAVERSGLRLNASGAFEMDSAMMRANDFVIATPISNVRLNAFMGMGDLATDPNLPIGVDATANIGLYDIVTAFPSVAPIIKGLPQSDDAIVGVRIGGTSGAMRVNQLRATLPGHADISLSGDLRSVFDPSHISGMLDIDGHITDVEFAKQNLLDPSTAKMVRIAPLTLDGSVAFSPQDVKGDLTATTDNGDVALKASWRGASESYDVDLALRDFPFNSFLPTMGIGRVTATLKAGGKGYDPFKQSTAMSFDADIASAIYQGERYSNVRAIGTLTDGHGDIELVSLNPACDFDIHGQGNIAGDHLDWTFSGDIRNIDLLAMKLSTEKADGAVSFDGSVSATSDFRSIDARMNISQIEWHAPDLDLNDRDIALTATMNDSLIKADLNNRDLRMAFTAPCNLDTLLARLDQTTVMTDSIMRHKRLDVRAFERALPPFDLSLSAGQDNILTNLLRQSDISIYRMLIKASNDSLIHALARLNGISSGSTNIDSVAVDLNQQGEFLLYNVVMRNLPGTMDEWASVDASGYIAGDEMAIMFNQRNIESETGYMLGAMLTSTDSTFTFNIAPYHPIIAYKRWDVNPDNEVSLNYRENHLDANLTMTNHESSVSLKTEHRSGSHDQEDVVVNIKDLQIADWIAVNPFAPPMSGLVSADMRFKWDKVNLNGVGTVGVADFTYGKERVGTFDLDVDVTTGAGGRTTANVALLVDGVKTITASGALNDSTATNPFLLDFSMIRFPLSVLNPFLPPGSAKLSGMVNGNMDITGDVTHPVFNGSIDFDSTSVMVNMLGTAFRFSDAKVPVKNNVIRFTDFSVMAVNDNPLRVNGTVNMQQIDNPKIDLSLYAHNMQVVGTDRPRGADIYGKAFIDVDAKAKGDLRLLDIDAALKVLPGTNVTYVMSGEAQSAITSQGSTDMVRFVNFADTAQVVDADSVNIKTTMVNIDATLTVSSGTTFNVDLLSSGKLQIEGQGTLNYTQNFMADSRCVGRFNINKGFVRYALPLVGEKRFDFNEGSYIGFNGNLLNPVLNIHAIDKIKANVTQEGQNSRLVNFNVGLDVTNTLQNMNVAFDLSTDDDLTVANELQSMSPEQRANQAMNILLYGMYSGAGTKGNANLGGNMLYSFLESQLNAWAANNIRGVDLSFGIDQYNQTTDGSTQATTSYSYQVSKSLFDNRFKIVVGGNYTTDADTDENFAENLINDISFEYLLNRSGTMYVRLFRHVGYESILEGEVTQTGVGFVYKRKISRISDIFRFLHRGRRRQQQNQIAPPQQGAPLTPVSQ